MTLLLLHAVLAFVWTALTERFTPANFVLGFALAHLALRFSPARAAAIQKTGPALRLVAFFAKDVLLSAVRVARGILTPRPILRPAVVGVPLDVRTDGQITLLAVLITLTPGTVALDLSRDRRTLVVHALFAADPARVREEIKSGYERRILELSS